MTIFTSSKTIPNPKSNISLKTYW